MSTDWKLKIQTLLALPPDVALLFEGADGWVKSDWEALGITDEVPRHVQQAHEIAFGLDVPPFVRRLAFPPLAKGLVFAHPLSGQSESLNAATLDQDGIRSALQQALRRLSHFKGDHRKLYLALWRFLVELSRDHAPAELKKHWGLLPADPRLPDHSIWDHASLASAIAGTWNPARARHEPALLLFTIASVQEFLMTARRTQDLWMGSYLISFLVWEGIKVIAERCGPDCVIYPDLRGQPLTDLWLFKEFFSESADLWAVLPETPSFARSQPEGLGEDVKVANFPNLFTAIVPAQLARCLAEDVTNAIRDKWSEIANSVREVLEAVYPECGCDAEWTRLWKEQVPDLLERLGIFWVTYPLDRSAEVPESADRKIQVAINEFVELVEQKGTIEEALTHFKRLYEASKEWANIGMGYSLVSQLAARALTNRKSLRDFEQREAPREKCSLCGVRSALHIEGKGGYTDLRGFWDILAGIDKDIALDGRKHKVKLAGRIKRGDRLCAVCLTRRLAWEHFFLPRVFGNILQSSYKNEHLLFPSTSSIATASYKKKVLEKITGTGAADKALRQAVQGYVKDLKRFLQQDLYDILYYSAPIPALEKLVINEPGDIGDFTRIDGDWLFDESFDSKRIRREYPVGDNPLIGLESARAAAARLRAAVAIKPARYYALIAMDGDHMGQWVSGQKSPTLREVLHHDALATLRSPEEQSLLALKRPLGPTLHMALSAALKNFALQGVREIVEEEHIGKLIYAGGDDVLAFVPLDELLPVLRKLSSLFSGEPVDPEPQKLKEVRNGFATRVNRSDDWRRFMLMGFAASLSAGIAVVHHTHPFSHAVEEAYRAMKETAKEKLGRRAFAIHLMKRSGQPLEVGARWRLGGLDTLAQLERVVRFTSEGKLSSKLAYDLKDAALGLNTLGLEAQEAELGRLVGRHVARKEDRPEVGGCLVGLLQKLHALSDTTSRQGGTVGGERPSEQAERQPHNLEPSWDTLTKLLLLARFMAEEGSHD